MSHKQALSLNVLTAVSLILAAPLALAQVFVGTPAPQQFAAQGQPSTKNGEWVTNGADLQFTRYSPLDQINAQNFDKLEVAWRFKTDAFGPYPEYKLEGTPIMIKGVLYTTAGTRSSDVALDPKSGEIICKYSICQGKHQGHAPLHLPGLGLNYCADPRHAQ